MYISSINSFTASWLLLCLIVPFHSGAESSDWIPYEIDDPVHNQFRSIPPKPVSLEEQFRHNVPKPSPLYNIYYPKYNSLRPGASTKNHHSEGNPKLNVARSMSKHQLEEVYRPYYYSQFENRETPKEESATRLEREETREIDEEIIRKMNILDKILSEDTDENDVDKNTVEDGIISKMNISEETKRVVRQVRKQRPGFFWTLVRLAFEVRIIICFRINISQM